MNLVVFAGLYPPDTGGYPKNVHQLCSRLTQRGHDVTIVTCGTQGQLGTERIDGVEVLRFPSHSVGPLRSPRPRAFLPWFLRPTQADVVLTQTRFFPTTFWGYLYAKCHRLPLIHTERGGSHTVINGRMASMVGQAYDHTAGALIVRGAQRNIGVSDAATRFIRHIGGHGQTIYNGIADCPICNRAYTPDCSRVIFVGRLVEAKGVQDLITAVNSCCAIGGRLHLTIVGDGPYRPQLEALAKQSPCAATIQFLGDRPVGEVPELLAQAGIFVNPSYSEGLPTSVLEAASAGLPIIATDVGGTGEIIEDGVSGIIVQPRDAQGIANALLRLHRHKAHALTMGARARQAVQGRFAWAVVVNQWELLLREVTHGKPTHHWWQRLYRVASHGKAEGSGA